MWSYSYREGPPRRDRTAPVSGRGVAYWTDGMGDDHGCCYVTTGYRLVALNAKNGS